MSNAEGASRATSYLVLGLLAGLYAAQSVTGSMVQTALPVVLRDSGMPLDRIGYLSVLFLPWALKFIWAPLVDRFGSQRNWILGCQAALIVCFGVASFLPPSTHLGLLSCVLMAMAFIASTQDVATDSLAVHATTTHTRGKASGASTAGGYLGFFLGSGVWLPVYAYAGWAVSMLVMAAALMMLTLPTLAAGKLGQSSGVVRSRPSFGAVIANRPLMSGIGFLVLYQCGVRLGVSMVGPFLVDAGIPVAEIGWIKGAGGALVGFVAALTGAALVQLWGAGRALAAFALLNIAACAGLAAYAFDIWHGTAAMIVLLLIQGGAVAMSFVALYAMMMNWCSNAQVATDFAVLQSVDALLAIAMGSAAGLLGQHFGYGAIFLATMGLLALAGWAALSRGAPNTPASSASILTQEPVT